MRRGTTRPGSGWSPATSSIARKRGLSGDEAIAGSSAARSLRSRCRPRPGERHRRSSCQDSPEAAGHRAGRGARRRDVRLGGAFEHGDRHRIAGECVLGRLAEEAAPEAFVVLEGRLRRGSRGGPTLRRPARAEHLLDLGITRIGVSMRRIRSRRRDAERRHRSSATSCAGDRSPGASSQQGAFSTIATLQIEAVASRPAVKSTASFRQQVAHAFEQLRVMLDEPAGAIASTGLLRGSPGRRGRDRARCRCRRSPSSPSDGSPRRPSHRGLRVPR